MIKFILLIMSIILITHYPLNFLYNTTFIMNIYLILLFIITFPLSFILLILYIIYNLLMN